MNISTFVGFILWIIYSCTDMDNIKIHNNHYSGSAQNVSTSNCHIHNITTTNKTQPNPYNANLKPTPSVWQQSHRHCTYSYKRHSHSTWYCSGTNTHTQLGTAVVPTRTLNLVLQWYQQAHSTWYCSGTNRHSHSTWYCSGNNTHSHSTWYRSGTNARWTKFGDESYSTEVSQLQSVPQ